MFAKQMVYVLTTLIVAWSWVAFGDSDFPLHGRISYDTGTLIKGARDDDWSRATLNTLVLEGDTIWVDKGSNTEIELPGGTFLRMADASKAKIVQLSPDIIIQGIIGSFYIERVVRSSGRVEFVTPACRISFDPETFTRIDIGDGGATQITTRWGRAYVTTERGGNEVVAGGKRCWVDVGYLPSETVSFALDQMDAFDRWSKSRSELIAEPVRTPPKYVEVRSTTIGYADLNHYGEWILIEERYYWRPTVVVGYVPYRVGYWTYVPVVGSVWIETYPFGYITTHYGRWVYYETYGWVWGFDPVWAPAWVATVRCGDYFIWTPVDFYCRPVRVSASVCFTIGGLDFYIGACSYVPVTYVYTCPWYIAPVPVTVVNYVVTNPVNIYVWNIDCRPRPVINIPYRASLPLVRDYNPPRAIRGVPYYDYARAQGGVLASARVNELESSFSIRTSTGGFRSSRDITPRLTRTPMGEDVINRFRSVRVENTSPKPEMVRFDRFSEGIGNRDRIVSSGEGSRGERFSVDTTYTRAIERGVSNQVRDGEKISIRSLPERHKDIRTDTINTLRNENGSNSGVRSRLDSSPVSNRTGIRENLTRVDDINRTIPNTNADTSRTEMRNIERNLDVARGGLNDRTSMRTPVGERAPLPMNVSRIDMDGEQKPRGSGSSDKDPYNVRRPGSGSGSSGSGGPSIRPTPSPRPSSPPSGSTPSPYPGNRERTTPRSELFDNSRPTIERFPLNTARENSLIRPLPTLPSSSRIESGHDVLSRGNFGGFTSHTDRTPPSFNPSIPSVDLGRVSSRGGISSSPSIGNLVREAPQFSSPRIETPSMPTMSGPIGRPSIHPTPSFSPGHSISPGIRGRIR